ncbi:hypothetical protein GCM10009425_38070 [Pseudomonas asuensis]|uniref:Uncharacterized protein n=1 Tax=Pseudomonas asuensis TaxID=1825787 RepID=A0ABQ2H0I9_9PSED|nr:hypothetical protein GCM10009425_38070 [Pseudomonas asuensis]
MLLMALVVSFYAHLLEVALDAVKFGDQAQRHISPLGFALGLHLLRLIEPVPPMRAAGQALDAGLAATEL